MITFLLLLVDQLRSYLGSLLGSDASPAHRSTPSITWHRLLYVPVAARNRIYATGFALILMLPMVARAQLITVDLPTSICAGQTTTLSVAINLPLNVPLNALTITATAPAGLTATVDVQNATSATVTVITSPTITTGIQSLTLNASTTAITLPGLPPVIPPTTIPGITLSVPVDIPITGLPVVAVSTLPGSVSVGSLLTLGTCPLGSVLSYTLANGTLGTGSLALTPDIAGQPVRIACNGTCVGLPTTLALPNIAGLSLNAPLSVCVGTPLSLTLLPTGLNLAQAGITLTAATPTGALVVSALGPDGVLTVSGGNLTVGNPTSVTVTALLNNIPLVSASVNINVLAQPTAPTQPGTLTATVGNVLSLTGLCPLGTVLTTGPLTGNGIIPVPTVTVGVQSLTVLCSNGTCLSAPTIVDVSVLPGGLGIGAPASICVGTPLSLTLLPTGLDLTQTGISISAATPSGALVVSALGPDGVLSITGGNLTVGNPTALTVTVSLFNQPLISASVNINVLPVPAAPAQPGTLTTTVGSVLSLTGLCPVGTVLTTGPLTGNGIIPIPTVTAGVQSLTVLCSNGTCLSVPTVIDVIVNPTPTNQPPVLTGTGITSPQTATVGVGFTTTTAQAFNDPDGGPLTYTASPLPAGVAINPTTGVISGTPSTTVGSPFTVTVTATDPQLASVSTSFVLNVVNQPVATTPFSITGVTTVNCQVISAGQRQVTFNPLYAGLNGQPITFRVVNESTPTTAPGPYTLNLYTDNPVIVLRATQAGSAGEASFTYNWLTACGNTTPTNQAPVLTGTGVTSPQTATVGVGFTTTTAQAFNDPDGGPLTYTASPLPAGVAINPTTGVISGTPSTTVGSPFSVIVTATDPQQASVSTSFVLNVVNPGNGPVTPPTTCGSSNLDGSTLRAIMPSYDCAQLKTSGNIQFIAAGGSPTGGVVEFKAIGVTDWTTNCQQIIDRETRTACDAAPIEIQVRQLINGSYVYGTSFIFDIRRQCPVAGCGGLPVPNRAPVVSAGIPNQVATVGQEFKYKIPGNAFTDPDGDELLYMSSRLPDSFTFSSGFFGAYPTQAEVLTVTVTAYDNSGGSVSTNFTITVNPNPTPQPPVTPQPPATACGSTSLDGSTLRATVPSFDCAQLKTSGNIQFTAAGGSATGGAVEFRAIGVTDWTTNCQQIVDRETRTACDAAPIEIQVRQLVNGSYVYGTPFVFNIRQACPIAGCASARVMAEAKAPLDVRVLGNPTRDESISVDIRGAEGEPLHMQMVDLQGFTVGEQRIKRAGDVEHQTLKLGRSAGIYLLRVSTPTQMQTVKVVKE